MTTVTPFLWYDDDLDQAIELYSSVFDDVTVHGMNRGPDGALFGAELEIAGQRVMGMNGGPGHPFSDGFSFFVLCADQEEVDRYWDGLTANGGEAGRCGWLKDRFGLSWQIVPRAFTELASSGTPEQVGRLMAAMMTMNKMDVAGLRAAFDG
jgi:predicted 3-demethylubiquinone-9 3-methyltransferase (glyoxalase superfamily)